MPDRLASVEQSLARLEERAAHLDQRIENVLSNQVANHQCLQKALHGSNGNEGLVVRTDRLEQWRGRIGKVMTLVVVAVAPLVAAKVWELVSQ